MTVTELKIQFHRDTLGKMKDKREEDLYRCVTQFFSVALGCLVVCWKHKPILVSELYQKKLEGPITDLPAMRAGCLLSSRQFHVTDLPLTVLLHQFIFISTGQRNFITAAFNCARN